jgi:hypothetical protein
MGTNREEGYSVEVSIFVKLRVRYSVRLLRKSGFRKSMIEPNLLKVGMDTSFAMFEYSDSKWRKAWKKNTQEPR